MIKHGAAVMALIAVTSSAWALDLKDAKASGAVKEKGNGYLVVVSETNKDAVALVKDVNGKRKAKYADIAKRNNISLGSVEKQAAKKLSQ
ncbi:hypothetical protein A9Q99_10705 [Gammaproteobacteria bacterium 45_16_T64]|nr:hypothetical protein A9Q99_10705 [Gammaproteobacteria bacterium 45_16_T64]